MDLDDVSVDVRTLPSGGVQTGPADELRIGLAKHGEREASRATQKERRERCFLNPSPRHEAAELTQVADEGLKVLGVGARRHERHLGDGHERCDLAGDHASEGYPNETVPRLDAMVTDELSRIVGEAQRGRAGSWVVHPAGRKGELIVGKKV